MTDDETTARIRDVLADAEEPLRVGAIQRRLATRSRDVTTSVIRQVCRDLEANGVAEQTDETPPAYRLTERTE